MGIRIKKVLGYGLTNLNPKVKKKGLLADDRFNADGYFGLDYVDNQERFSLDGYKNYLHSMRVEHRLSAKTLDCSWTLSFLDEEGTHLTLNSFIVYDEEYGSARTIVFIPPTTVNEWSRYDDAIDYYEYQIANKSGMRPNVKSLQFPLYPWLGYNCLKGSEVICLNNLQTTLYNQWRHTNDKQHKQLTEKLLVKELSLSSVDDIETQITPMVPSSLVLLLEYLMAFNDEKTIYTLKPLIYTYWS